MDVIKNFIGLFSEKTIEKSSGIDMDNVIASMFLCQPIYDKLKIKCHPDRFESDSKKRIEAEDLFQELQKNKNNYAKLKKLELKINDWLNVDKNSLPL